MKAVSGFTTLRRRNGSGKMLLARGKQSEVQERSIGGMASGGFGKSMVTLMLPNSKALLLAVFRNLPQPRPKSLSVALQSKTLAAALLLILL